MAGFIGYEDRRVIPRWRTFNKTLSLGELDPVENNYVHFRISYDFLAQKISDWRKYRTVAHATDLVGSASLIIGKTEDVNIIAAARFLLRDDISVSPWSREIARRILKRPDTNESISNVEELDKKIWELQRMLDKSDYRQGFAGLIPGLRSAWSKIARAMFSGISIVTTRSPSAGLGCS